MTLATRPCTRRRRNATTKWCVPKPQRGAASFDRLAPKCDRPSPKCDRPGSLTGWVRLLVRAGADLKAQNTTGFTPAHLAAMHKHKPGCEATVQVRTCLCFVNGSSLRRRRRGRVHDTPGIHRSSIVIQQYIQRGCVHGYRGRVGPRVDGGAKGGGSPGSPQAVGSRGPQAVGPRAPQAVGPRVGRRVGPRVGPRVDPRVSPRVGSRVSPRVGPRVSPRVGPRGGPHALAVVDAGKTE
eukprot:1195303-Prorocentrum_minimum.AAC.8